MDNRETNLLRSNQILEASDNSDFTIRNQFEQRKSKKYTIISTLLLMIPISIFLYCYIESGGSTSEDGEGAIWWLFVLAGPIMLPCFVASIIFAIFKK